MAVTLDQYELGRSNFQACYFLSSCNTEFGGQEIGIPWSSLSDAVNDFITDNSVAASSVALRLVYCFDGSSQALYLRMQILTMTLQTGSSTIYDLNQSPSVWYQISSDGLATTTDTSLSNSAYLNKFFYCPAVTCSSETVQQLSADASIYAQYAVFPWEAEVQKLYVDNGSGTDMTIVFAACSFAGLATDAVLYPHTLVLYLKNSSGDKMLDNIQSKSSNSFSMKGADMASICPLCCNLYISPM